MHLHLSRHCGLDPQSLYERTTLVSDFDTIIKNAKTQLPEQSINK